MLPHALEKCISSLYSQTIGFLLDLCAASVFSNTPWHVFKRLQDFSWGHHDLRTTWPVQLSDFRQQASCEACLGQRSACSFLSCSYGASFSMHYIRNSLFVVQGRDLSLCQIASTWVLVPVCSKMNSVSSGFSMQMLNNCFRIIWMYLINWRNCSQRSILKLSIDSNSKC